MCKCFFSIIIICCLIPSWASGFDHKQTHPLLTGLAVNNTEYFRNFLITQLGYDKHFDEQLRNGDIKRPLAIAEWLELGSREEDEPACRASNHFHDPLKDWSTSKLTDTMWIVDRWCDATSPFREKYSNISWATGYSDANGTLMPTTVNGVSATPDANGRNWFVARAWYYWALVETDPQKREKGFAETFRTIGYVLHLLEDMAVPAHTRNDFSQGHSQLIGCPAEGDCDFWGLEWIGNPFEGYVRDHFKEIVAKIKENSGEISEPYTGGIKLTNFWDTDRIHKGDTPSDGTDIGLAEYSNGNFLTHATAFAAEYPYPAKGIDAEKKSLPISDPFHPGTKVQREYWMKKATATTDTYRLTGVDYHTFVMEYLYNDGIKQFKTLPPMDDYVFLDYAKLLIPRAVGYSAALIDYFFRGRILVEQPSFVINPDGTIIGINGLQVQNVTSSDNGQTIEPLGPVAPELPGTLDLVYYYTPVGESTPVYHVLKDVYEITSVTNPINNDGLSIGPIAFRTNEYIPSDIAPEDITLMLVFKGRLGSEENAVAAQTFTGKLPPRSRIAYGYQPGGQPNTSNIFTISPDGTDSYQITNASSPNPWYFSPVWSMDGSMMAFEKETCTDPNPNPSDPTCPAQYHLRDIIGIDLLSELKYPDNVLFERNFNGDSVANASFSPDGTMVAALKRNESGWYYYASLVVFDLANNNQWIVNGDDDPNVTSLYGSAPAWSPAGDKIAYYLNSQYDAVSGTMQFEGDLFLIDPFNGQKTRLTNDDFNNTQPSWSPDGEWIAFSSDRDGEASMDIWLMDKNGGNLARLVDCTPASCYSPTFSPDGQTVAFSNGSTIYTVGIDGDPYSLKEVAHPGQYISGITWSPTLVPPSFLDVRLEPTTIIAGGSTVLSWQTDRSTEVLIEGIAGEQPVNGSIALSPISTTTYTLTAKGPTGTTQTAVTVIVE